MRHFSLVLAFSLAACGRTEYLEPRESPGVDSGRGDAGRVDSGVPADVGLSTAAGDSGTCAPKTCHQQGFNCGPASDGCGEPIECGTCQPSACAQTCGGGGVPNRCGSAQCCPKTCQSAGANCGVIGDGCGSELPCGKCPSGESCGGGGLPNVCGGASQDAGLPDGSTAGSDASAVDYEWAQWPVPPESPTDYSIGSDTVTDNVTGLIWQLAPQDQVFGGPDAEAYCAELSLAGR